MGTWPRWLCWAFGHEPTERDPRFAATRCRCGAFAVTDESVFRGGGWQPRFWTGLIRLLPLRGR